MGDFFCSHLHAGNVGEWIPGRAMLAGLRTGFETFVFAFANSIRIVVGRSGSNRTPYEKNDMKKNVESAFSLQKDFLWNILEVGSSIVFQFQKICKLQRFDF